MRRFSTGHREDEVREIQEESIEKRGDIVSVKKRILKTEDNIVRRSLYRECNPDAEGDEKRNKAWRNAVRLISPNLKFGFEDYPEKLNYQAYLDTFSLEELAMEAEYLKRNVGEHGLYLDEFGCFIDHLRLRLLDPVIILVEKISDDSVGVDQIIIHTAKKIIKIPLQVVFRSGEIHSSWHDDAPDLSRDLSVEVERVIQERDVMAEKESVKLDSILELLNRDAIIKTAYDVGNFKLDVPYWLSRETGRGGVEYSEGSSGEPFYKISNINEFLGSLQQKSAQERQTISGSIGAELASAARRYGGIHYLLSLLLRRDPELDNVFKNLSIKEAKDYWGYETFASREKEDISFGMLRGYWQYFDEVDLKKQISFAEWLERQDLRLDMTRGNDPTVFYKGYFSGPTPHDQYAADYDEGIYFGVQGEFYEWCDNAEYRAIIKRMPVVMLTYLGSRGEGLVKAGRLKVNRANAQIEHGSVFDGDTAEYEWYNPTEAIFKRIPRLDLRISDHVFAVFKKYYPSASLAKRTVSIGESQVEYPFIVIAQNEAANPHKLWRIREATNCTNVLILN